MKEIKPTQEMINKAPDKIIFCYRDINAIRMETENGINPYVWRNNSWREMKLDRSIVK